VAPQTIDARRCISYLTIEHPGALDGWESDALGSWIYGCDVCQEVCPVNAEADDPGALRVPLLPMAWELVDMTGRGYQRAFGESAMSRAGRHRLLRNVLTVLGNAPLAGVADAALALARAAARDHRAEVQAAAVRLEERALRA
jgi:epoxyqueuosine reductase